MFVLQYSLILYGKVTMDTKESFCIAYPDEAFQKMTYQDLLLVPIYHCSNLLPANLSHYTTETVSVEKRMEFCEEI